MTVPTTVRGASDDVSKIAYHHVLYEVSSSEHEYVSLCTDLCIGMLHGMLVYTSRTGECIC